MTMTPQSWARDLLTKLGYPVSANNMASVLAWEYQEGGHFNNDARFNPLNTTMDHQRYGSINSVGVARYPDYATGMRETVDTVKLPAYAKIRNALRVSAAPATTTAAIKASPWGTWHGGGAPGPLVKRAQGEVAAHPSWYDAGQKGKTHTRTHRSRQRLVVYPAELADVVSQMRKESDNAAYIARGVAKHAAELDGLVSSGWAAPDPARLDLVRRQIEAARDGRRGAVAASNGLAETASWVSWFRSQILAADGPQDGGNHKPGNHRPAPPDKAPPGQRSRTQKVHKMLAEANAQLKRHVNDGGTNHTLYGAWFGTNGVQWCAQFVSWVFAHSGNRLPSLDGAKGKGFQYCPDALNYARVHGQLHEKPHLGDVMLYHDGEHTGIVSKVYGDGSFDTIEGNAGPGDTTVWHYHHTLDDSAAKSHGGYRFWTAIR